MEYRVINSRGRKVRQRFTSIQSARQYLNERGKRSWSVQVMPINVTHYKPGVATVGLILVSLPDGTVGTLRQLKHAY